MQPARQRAAGPVQARAQPAAAALVAVARPPARVRASRRHLQAASRACPPPSGPDGRGAGAIRPGIRLSATTDASPGEPRRLHPPTVVPPSSTDPTAAPAAARNGTRNVPQGAGPHANHFLALRASRAAQGCGCGVDPPSLQAKQRSAPEATGPQPAVAAHAQQGDRHAAALQGPEEGGHGRQVKPPLAQTPADRRHSSGRRGSVHSRAGRRCPPDGAGRGPRGRSWDSGRSSGAAGQAPGSDGAG